MNVGVCRLLENCRNEFLPSQAMKPMHSTKVIGGAACPSRVWLQCTQVSGTDKIATIAPTEFPSLRPKSVESQKEWSNALTQAWATEHSNNEEFCSYTVSSLPN